MPRIRLICFDFDGVLVDSRKLHFDCLNEALPPEYRITWHEHSTDYEGLSTREKLKILAKTKGLPAEIHDSIWHAKQALTHKHLKKHDWSKLFGYLKSKGVYLAICSNAIRQTVEMSIDLSLVDLSICGNEVKWIKPYPEIYWKAMIHFGCLPSETLVVEDSPRGIKAAIDSGAYVIEVSGPKDLTESLFEAYLA